MQNNFNQKKNHVLVLLFQPTINSRSSAKQTLAKCNEYIRPYAHGGRRLEGPITSKDCGCNSNQNLPLEISCFFKRSDLLHGYLLMLISILFLVIYLVIINLKYHLYDITLVFLLSFHICDFCYNNVMLILRSPPNQVVNEHIPSGLTSVILAS